jgi:CspA family cold shock protein
MNGKIKWFNPIKGYGFITVEGRGDVFLHVSALEKANIQTLQVDESIEFDVGDNKGKETAINVKRVTIEGWTSKGGFSSETQ